MKRTFPPRLMPCAFRLLLVGHILILLSLCNFAARLASGGSVEVLLYIGEYIHSVAAAWVMLWGAGLGLDLWERSSG